MKIVIQLVLNAHFLEMKLIIIALNAIILKTIILKRKIILRIVIQMILLRRGIFLMKIIAFSRNVVIAA